MRGEKTPLQRKNWSACVTLFLGAYLLILQCRVADCFNVFPHNVEYLRPPTAKGRSQLGVDQSPDFFGYNFAISMKKTKLGQRATFLMGSPYSMRGSLPSDESTLDVMEHPGSLYRCAIVLSETGASKTQKCRPASPVPLITPRATGGKAPLLTGGDAMGLNIAEDPFEDKLTACAPTRRLNCSSVYLTTGACYDTDDTGKTWTKSSKQASDMCPMEHLDLFMVLDGSASVLPHNFESVKGWVKDLTSNFDINSTAFGVVQYSYWQEGKPMDEQEYMKVEIKLGEFKTRASFDEAVDKIKYQSFTTDTAHAINLTVGEFERSPEIDNPGNRKVMVLLTDGKSTDSKYLEDSAKYARSKGITTYAVGVGNSLRSELEVIAGDPERVMKLNNFDDLDTIVDQLKKKITGFLEGGGNQTNELLQAESGFSSAYGRVISCESKNPIRMYDKRRCDSIINSAVTKKQIRQHDWWQYDIKFKHRLNMQHPMFIALVLIHPMLIVPIS